MARRVVVTGGGGFIGAYLVKRLVRDGWDVEDSRATLGAG